MNLFADYYKQAEFALAAYSTLAAGISGKLYTDALEANGQGMPTAQATHFADTYKVVDQYNNPNGLSVTVFENKLTGEKHLAIRGTDDLNDVLSDIVDIALLGSTKLQAQGSKGSETFSPLSQ